MGGPPTAWLRTVVPGLLARGIVAAPPHAPTLRNEVRRAIHDAVVARPGMGMRDLAAKVGLDWSSVHYHVQHLVAAGLLVTFPAGRRRLVYPASAVDGDDPAQRAAVLEATTRRIAAAIAASPGTSATELVEDLKESPRVVYHHVRRLLDHGLVTAPSSASRRGLQPTPRLLALLAEHESRTT